MTYKKDPEKVKASSKKRWEKIKNDPDLLAKKNTAQRKYREKNKDEINAKTRGPYTEHEKELQRARSKRHYQKHREEQRKRNRDKNRTPSGKASVRKAIKKYRQTVKGKKMRS